NADTSQHSVALSSATQVHPENSNLSVRVLSPGNGGSVSQSNEADSSANAQNTAPVTQTASQTGLGAPCACSCGCTSSSPAVQALGQSSWIGQHAGALSSAWQIGAKNESGPVRIASDGNGGSVAQSNEAESSASASNTASPYQAGSQVQGGSGVQALGQHSSIWQGALAASSAYQLPGESRCGCGSSFGNSAGPI